MSSCVILDASTDCGPQFEGYPVLSPSISIFASLVTSQIESTSAIRDVFVQQYSCTNNSNLLAAIQSRRFHLSYTCSVAVNQAILAGCKFSSTLPPAGPILCSSQCSSAVSSLTAVFGDRTACPTSSNSSIEAQKDTLRNSFSNYCRNATNSLSSNSNLCIAGVPLETQNCGK